MKAMIDGKPILDKIFYTEIWQRIEKEAMLAEVPDFVLEQRKKKAIEVQETPT